MSYTGSQTEKVHGSDQHVLLGTMTAGFLNRGSWIRGRNPPVVLFFFVYGVGPHQWAGVSACGVQEKLSF